MKKGEGPIEKLRLYNNEKVIPNFKIIYYNETSLLPRVKSIKVVQLLRVLILSRVCFVSLSILADVYRAHAIFQILMRSKDSPGRLSTAQSRSRHQRRGRSAPTMFRRDLARSRSSPAENCGKLNQ